MAETSSSLPSFLSVNLQGSGYPARDYLGQYRTARCARMTCSYWLNVSGSDRCHFWAECFKKGPAFFTLPPLGRKLKLKILIPYSRAGTQDSWSPNPWITRWKKVAC